MTRPAIGCPMCPSRYIRPNPSGDSSRVRRNSSRRSGFAAQRYYRRQPLRMTPRQQLKQPLLPPRTGRTRRQVVQYQQLGFPHLLKQVYKPNFGIIVKPAPQIVQQVGGGDEQRRLPQLNPTVGDGGGQVSLAAAAGAGKG